MSSRNILSVYSILIILLVYISSVKSQSLESTRIDFGSCNHQNIPNAITWASIVDRRPDLFIWTGDVVYLDHDLETSKYPYSDYSVILYVFNAFLLGNPPVVDTALWPAKYELMKDNIKYQELKNITPIIGIWDDHDIGENNADYTWEHKDYAQELFLDFLEIAENDPLRNQSGVYQYYEMQKQFNVNDMTFVKSIDIIMFDTRYFSKRDGEEDLLGAEQWAWFEDTIQNNLHGELLLIISGVQIMNDPPLNSREGWYKYPESQQRLFRLLDEYNTCDRLLLISGDVHLSEMMHGQCNGKSVNNSDVQTDYYEITSSGFTHAMMFESPFLEKFSYRLDDYAREDGVMGCNWLGLNFGELNIDWYFNETQNDVKIRNVSVEVRDEKGDIKCIQDLPMFGYSDHHEYSTKSNYLWDNDYHICYGAETFHSKHGVKSVIAVCGMSWVIMVLYPNVWLLMLFVLIVDKCAEKICPKWHAACSSCDTSRERGLTVAERERIKSLTPQNPDPDDVFPGVAHKEKTKKEEEEQNGVEMITINKNDTTKNEEDTKNKKDETNKETKGTSLFGNMLTLTRKNRAQSRHAADPSLMNPSNLYGNDDANIETEHHNAYYKTYGYVMLKNRFLYYTFVTVVWLIGFKLLGPYNTEYPGNLTVLITFGIMYCWQEICFGFYCVYAFEVAKHVCIVTTFVCGVGIIVSWISYKEIIISLLLILAECVSIISSIFVISHGYMPKTYITIIAFQIIVVGHKIYTLGSHLIYVHNYVPGHTAVGWYWLVQICLIKMWLQQFVFRKKLEYITSLVFDHIMLEHKKYRLFEILFAVLLALVFVICSFYMATNTNDWDEGYVAVGTYLELSFMFNWPSAIFLALWLWIKDIKISKEHELFHKQLTMKTLRSLRHIQGLSGVFDEEKIETEIITNEEENHQQNEKEEIHAQIEKENIETQIDNNNNKKNEEEMKANEDIVLDNVLSDVLDNQSDNDENDDEIP